MSTLDTARPAAPRHAATTAARPGLGPALRWELRKLRAQHRTRAVLLGALLAPVPVVLVLHGQSRPPKDTLLGRYATENGFALTLLVLTFAAQWVLPLLVAVVAGDLFSSEDQHGTWKTVLTRSTSRASLFWAKALAAMGFAVLTVVVLAVSTTTASLLVVGHQPLVALSGQSIPAASALPLVGAAWATALLPTLAFATLAILLSVASRSSAVGIAAPVVLGMVMQLVGALGGIEVLRPLLLTTGYEAWHGLLTDPQFVSPLLEACVTSLVWAVLTLGGAYVLLRRRDITGG